MTKSELRNGMLVKLRNDSVYIVIKGAGMTYSDVDFLVSLSDGCYLGLKDYNDNLGYGKCKSNHDIMEVSECKYIGDVIRGLKKGAEEHHFEGLKVLWTRESPEVSKVKSLIAELQGQLSAAQAKLEGLQC